MNSLANLARVTTATTGTGTITLGSAVTGFLTFAQAGVPDGSKISYGIIDGANSEAGWGIYTLSGTTLTRNVRRSTGAGNTAAISLSGSAQVFVTALAEDMVTAAADIAAVPATYLDFIDNWLWSAPYNPGNVLTCTRASAAYIDDTSGTWTSFATNTLRRSNKGLKREEARTNNLRNNSMQGAVAGTPGTISTNWTRSTVAGLTFSISTISTASGIDFIRIRLNGTPSASGNNNIAFESSTQIVAAQNEIWTQSVFLALGAGALTNVGNITTYISEYTAAGAFLASGNVGTITPTGAALGTQRSSLTRTLSNASTARVVSGIILPVTNGNAIDVSIDIGWPQLELGAYASSPIRTTSAAATRAADQINLNLPPTFGAAYSLFAQGTPDSPTAFATDQYLAAISDGTSTNRFGVLRLASTGVPNWIINSTKSGIGSTAHAQNASGKVAVGNAVSDQGGSFNGGTVANGTSATSPSGFTTVEIGGDGTGGGAWNGYIEKVMIWPDLRLDDIVLGGMAAGTRLPGNGHVTFLDYGTTTNDNAAAGHVGEIQSSVVLVGGVIALTTATPANVTSMSLTAGDWEVFGEVWFNPAGTTVASQQIAAISTTSATLPTTPSTASSMTKHSGTAATGIGDVLPVGPCRLSLATTTTVYLVAQSTFVTSTNGAFGELRARRLR
jgi:hypothetical protein